MWNNQIGESQEDMVINFPFVGTYWVLIKTFSACPNFLIYPHKQVDTLI